jgi:hypothetical protein
MAFELDLGGLSEVEIGYDGDYNAQFTVGYDLDANERVVMAIALIEDAERAGVFALVFGLLVSDLEGANEQGPFFDHATARKYISRADAIPVMDLVLNGVSALIDSVNPHIVEMATYEADLGHEAMRKYSRISDLLRYNYRFEVTNYWRDGTDLKDYWLFTKSQ